jgi:hypothetical protein
MPETKVFIGGSRRLSKLNAEVKRRIDNVVDSRFAVLVGDANGADKAVQQYLADRQYSNVTVFCMTGHCRNNVGRWLARDVAAPADARGFAFYTVKDRAMADAATHGLMLWDGESKGTLNNIVNLIKQQKPVVVYFSPAKTFVNVRLVGDVVDLLTKCDRSSVERFERELDLTHTLHHQALQP